MSNCSSGCPTKDHESYGECLKSKGAGVKVMDPSAGYMAAKKWQTEISEYRAARSQGIQPKSSQLGDIRRAVTKSQKLDRAVQET